MQRIRLREYERSAPVALSRTEMAGLRRLAPQVRIEASAADPDLCELIPGSQVGVVQVGGKLLEIRPKLPIDRLFFILTYAVDPISWQDSRVELAAEDTVLEVVAPAFCRLVARATYRGLLHGYRICEEALPLVRGQIRFRDQMQRRYGQLLPVEVRFDDFTEDIDENRVLLAALHQLSRLPLRSVAARRGLHEVNAAFGAVSLMRYDAQNLPAIGFSRLNAHYEPAIRLAKLILAWSSLEMGYAGATGVGFLVDMNVVFELFVHCALREALGLSEIEFPRGATGLCLDEAGQVRLEPDLSWWRGRRCRFVGDVKYKRVNVSGIKHPDLYQLLAYLTAADLPAGMLIYAAGEGSPARHRVTHAGKTLMVESLDLAGSPSNVLQQIDRLADTIRDLTAGTSLGAQQNATQGAAP